MVRKITITLAVGFPLVLSNASLSDVCHLSTFSSSLIAGLIVQWSSLQRGFVSSFPKNQTHVKNVIIMITIMTHTNIMLESFGHFSGVFLKSDVWD